MTLRNPPRRVLLAASATIGALALGGCYVVPVGPPASPVVIADVPPPPPRAEVYGLPPVVGQVWISGYWNWGGARFVWMPGYWSTPRPGYHWRPHSWAPHGNRWRLAPGYWTRR
jgi:hypothetical protein